MRSLILGWSDKVIAIVNQLCNANESEGGLPIVILSEQEKVRLRKTSELQLHAVT